MKRVKIGTNYPNQSLWRVYIAVPLVYLPLITTVPFLIIGILLVKIHLKWVGGMNIRSYWEFVPAWASHRYNYDNQITYSTESAWYNLRAHKFYWIFNCKLYCPLSVALFSYAAYLVKIVENWWCPFGHDKKEGYCDAAIDKSYWHLYASEREKLHSDDLNNPIWNEEVDQDKKETSD
jgi:hypothetical protein